MNARAYSFEPAIPANDVKRRKASAAARTVEIEGSDAPGTGSSRETPRARAKRTGRAAPPEQQLLPMATVAAADQLPLF